MNDQENDERCFEEKYVFIYTDKAPDNPRLLFNQLQNLTQGELLSVDFIEAGPGKLPAIRLSIQIEVECDEESENG